MKHRISIALLSLVACGGVNSGKSIEHPASPEAELGLGFDSLSGKTRGACVARRQAPPRAGARRLIETVFHARSKEEVLREVGYSGGINFGLFGFGLDLGFESLDRKQHSASTSFAVVRIYLEASSETLRTFELEEHAAETLRRDGPGQFYERCGDGFVSAVRMGGYFLGIVALSGVSDADTRRLSGSAGVSFLGLGVGGRAHTETRNFLERHQARYYIIQQGGDPGGVTSLQRMESIDDLLQRADHFKRVVVRGQGVPTGLVIAPYQVTSNRPRRASLWNLTTQRRFLEQLAVDYGELQRAEAELQELATAACARKGDRKRVERLRAQYQRSITATRQRAEDCMNDPQRRCTDRGLDTVDRREHDRHLALCPAAPALASVAAPPPRPGIDAPCKVWRFATASAQIAPSKPGGASWDADGSPPETMFMLWLGERKISFPTLESYASGGAIVDGIVSAGAPVRAVLIDRDAMFNDDIARIDDVVPEILADGVLRLESGRTSVSLQGTCVG